MIYLLSAILMFAAAVAALRKSRSGEKRLVLSASIARPAGVVFAVIGTIERTPVWRRGPGWLPQPLRFTHMIPWGNFVAPRRRKPDPPPRGTEEIRVRCLKDREFGYTSLRPHDLSFESTFRLASCEGGCLLTWEIRYRPHRLPDILADSAMEAGVKSSMTSSMELIRRIVLGYADPIAERALLYEARRDQVSAA